MGLDGASQQRSLLPYLPLSLIASSQYNGTMLTPNGTSQSHQANGENTPIPPQTICHKGFYLDGGDLYVLVCNFSR
jgi:hypothetical protein